MTNMAEHVVQRLVASGLVDPARAGEAEAVTGRALGETRQQPAGVTTRGRLVEIAAYVGGALVVAAVGLFLAQEWIDFSGTAQVATLAVICLLLLAAGVVASRVGGGLADLRAGRDEARRRLTSALLVGAALAGGFAVGQLVSISGDEPSSTMSVVAASATMLVLAALGYGYAWSALGLLMVAAAGLTAILNGLAELDDSGERSLLPALSLLAFAVVWLLLTETHRFREPMVARTVGMAVALLGAQLALVGDYPDLAYGLTLAVAVVGFAMYLRTAAWPYLVAGVLGITIVVPEAVIDWTGGALGPAGAVLVAGLTLLGASLAGLRVRKEVEQPDEPHHPDSSGHPGSSARSAATTSS